MHHEVVVSVGHRAGHAGEQGHARRHAQPTLVAVAVEGLAVDVLEGNEGPSPLVQPAIEQPGHLGVIEGGQDAAFALEAPQALGVGAAAPRELERHALLEGPVGALGQEDVGHAAAAQLGQHAVASHALALRRRAFLVHVEAEGFEERAAQGAAGLERPVLRGSRLAGGGLVGQGLAHERTAAARSARSHGRERNVESLEAGPPPRLVSFMPLFGRSLRNDPWPALTCVDPKRRFGWG